MNVFMLISSEKYKKKVHEQYCYVLLLDKQALSLGELQPTSIALQLADRSIKKPRGIIVEDVLVQVNQFILLADFVVLDMEKSPTLSSLSIILG
jgi:hypothetical protein